MKKTNLNIKMSGQYKLEVVDTQTGLLRYSLENKNMIVDNAFTTILNTFDGRLRNSANNRLFNNGIVYAMVGANSDPTTETMTEFSSAPIAFVAASTNSAESFNDSDDAETFYAQRFFKFSPGSFSDFSIVRELGLGLFPTQGQNYLFARVVLNNDISIMSTDELRITWRINYIFPTNRVFSGTIVDGQSDNETDIEWKLFMSNNQVTNFLLSQLGNETTTQGMFSNSTSSPFILLGDSNTDSTLTTDNLIGTQVYSGLTINELKNHTVALSSRSIEIVFEHDAPSNVTIGEMIVRPSNFASNLFRITFTPQLIKPEFFRLKLTYSLSLGRV